MTTSPKTMLRLLAAAAVVYIDSVTDLPGPGAVGINGNVQLLP